MEKAKAGMVSKLFELIGLIKGGSWRSGDIKIRKGIETAMVQGQIGYRPSAELTADIQLDFEGRNMLAPVVGSGWVVIDPKGRWVKFPIATRNPPYCSTSRSFTCVFGSKKAAISYCYSLRFKERETVEQFWQRYTARGYSVKQVDIIDWVQP